MFNVGTLLLAGTYTPAEKTRAHGLQLAAGLRRERRRLAVGGCADGKLRLVGVINLVCEPLLLVAVMALRPRAGVERGATGSALRSDSITCRSVA